MARLITNIIENSQCLFSNRRRQRQDWEADPPHALGWAIFFLVTLEFLVARQLFHDLGINQLILGQFLGIAVSLFIVEAMVVKITTTIAHYKGKKGDWKTTLTFLHIGLFPMLLFLPVTLVIWVGNGPALFRLGVFFLLILRVLSNWRVSVEISHEFSPLQSGLVLYSTIGIFLFFVFLAFYISLIGFVADIASVLQ